MMVEWLVVMEKTTAAGCPAHGKITDLEKSFVPVTA
jgi:hypothetical protein